MSFASEERQDSRKTAGSALYAARGSADSVNKRYISSGAPGVTRTPGTQFRKLLLYPPELRGHIHLCVNAGHCTVRPLAGHALAIFEAPTGRADVLMPHGEMSRPGAAARRGFRPVRHFPKLQQIGCFDATRREQGAQLAQTGGLDLTHALAAQLQALADRF
jgi:hypothetical protein